AGDVAQAPDAGKQEVRAAPGGHEWRHPAVPPAHGRGLHREAGAGPAPRPDQRVRVVVEAGEVRVVGPGALDELELARQVGVEADEAEAARRAPRAVGP